MVGYNSVMNSKCEGCKALTRCVEISRESNVELGSDTCAMLKMQVEASILPVIDELAFGSCGHPKAFLYKCPRKNESAKCVQCLICMLKEPYDTNCSALMADRVDYNDMPEMDLDLYRELWRIAEGNQKYKSLCKTLKGAVSEDGD